MDLSDGKVRRRVNKALREKGVPAKVCGKCFVVKGYDQFARQRQGLGGCSSQCKLCQASARRYRYSVNPERERASSQQWREANHVRVSEVGRRWYAANRERKAEYQSRWRSENPDYQREWYEDNRERKAKAGRVWRSANPGKARAVWRTCQQRRRATIAEATVEPFTARDLRRDWEDHDLYGCFFCGGTLTDGYEVEHFYALSKGGPHAVFNLVPSCVPCNRGAGGKGTKEPWGYLREALEEQGVDSDAVQAGVEAAIEARCRRRRPTLTDVSGSAFTTPTVMKSTTPV